MPNNKYWQDRFVMLQESQLKKGEQFAIDLEDQYLKASMAMEKQLGFWYQRFADNNKISLTDAKVMLNNNQLKEFKWDVKEYIRHGKENAIDQRWMTELENASARVHITRLEALKFQMQQQIEVVYGHQLDGTDNLMKHIYENGYYHTAFEIQKGFNVGWDLHKLNPTQLQSVISKPWTTDGRTFSDRIWGSKQDLINQVHTGLSQSIIRGDSPKQAIDSLAYKMKVKKNQAGRLIMTETAFFSSASQRDCFNDLDVEKFEVVATLDNKTSVICQDLDGHLEDMKNFEAGVTAPPFHVWCRSTTVPWFDDNFGERIAKGADRKTYYVDSNMKYKDWNKTFVDPNSSIGDIIKNEQIIPKTLGTIAANITTIAKFKTACDLTGVDLEVAKGIEESYDRIMTKFPQLKGKFDSLGIKEKGASTYASCYLYNGNINVNPSYYSKFLKISESYDADVKIGWHPPGTDWKSIITHEIGHAVDGVLSKNGHGTMSGFNIKNSSYEMRKQVLKELKLVKNDIGKEVSRYGSKNDAEFFAECFAEYIDSKTPRRVASKFGEILELWMKGVK